MIDLVKALHLSCVVLSFLGFGLRAWWMWRCSPLLQHILARTLPHLVDSLLLFSGITLVISYRISPLQQNWLLSKILALLLYIVAGSIALKRGKTKSQRLFALVFAIVCYGQIVSAAMTKSPWGYAAWFF